MLLAGWEVHIGKNCDLYGLEGLQNAALPRAAFLRLWSQFFPIRTDLKPDNNIFIIFFLAVNWLTSGFVYATLPLNWLYAPSTNLSQKRKNNEQMSKYLQDKLEKDALKNSFISSYFNLVAFRSPESSVFSDVSRKFEILCKVRR